MDRLIPTTALMSAFCVAFLLATSSEAQNQGPPPDITWEDYHWNPALEDAAAELPESEQLTLPLPCDGGIQFVRVSTQAGAADGEGALLADRRILLGRNSGQDSFIDFTRASHVAGPFASADGGRHFLMGKFEITNRQFDAVMGENCPGENEESGQPVVEVSWYDAVEFTRRINRFWYRDHQALLPRSQEAIAHARLPTESEWEFAARGGLMVTEAQFEANLFPMDGPLLSYAFYGDIESSDGRLNEVGLLATNPVGVRDILGNAAEMVFEPFRMNRAGRYHGQSGGFTVKGGSFATERDDLNAASRLEYPYFNATIGEEQRNGETGFRIVLSAQALGGLGEINKLREAWAAAASSVEETELSDPMGDLKAFADTMVDLEAKGQLERIRAAALTQSAARRELRDRLLRNTLNAGGYLHQSLCRINERLGKSQVVAKGLNTLAESYPDQYKAKADTQNLRVMRNEEAVAELAEVYGDNVVAAKNDFAQDRIDNVAGLLTQELVRRNRPNFAFNVASFVDMLEFSRTTNDATVEDLADRLDPNDRTVCRP